MALTVSRNGTTRLWDLRNLARIRSRVLSGQIGLGRSVDLTRDGKWALVGTDHGISQLWDLIPSWLSLEEVQTLVSEDIFWQRMEDGAELLKVFDNPQDLLKLLNAIYGDSQLAAHRDLRNKAGETLLMKLIEYSDLYVDIFDATEAATILRYLIANSDVNAADDQGETALIKATKKGDLSVIKLLLERGADSVHKDTNERVRCRLCAR